MIIDAHTHLFPRVVRENRERFLHGEPAFRLLYASPTSRMTGAEEIIRVMDEEGVDKSVTFGFPWRSRETARMHNDYILEAVSRYPDRLLGLACMDPLSPDAPSEFERCLDNGLQGVGELAFYTAGIDAPVRNRLAPVMSMCRERCLPVMFHAGEPVGHAYPGKTSGDLPRIYELVSAYPDNVLILSHWGGGLFFYRLLKRDMERKLENVYFDTAASPYLYQSDVYRVGLNILGLDKILFGSDFPLLKPSRYFKDMDASGLSVDETAAVLGENTARLFGIETRKATSKKNSA